MRSSSLLLVFLCACSPPPPALPGEPVLVWPAKAETSVGVTGYFQFDAGVAHELTELTWGMGEGFPNDVVLVPMGGYSMGGGCQLEYGQLFWRSLVSVEGTAAAVSLEGGLLHLTLKEAGEVSVLLAGELDEQRCGTLNLVPLQHRLRMRVRVATGFVVDQTHQRGPECDQRLVLPAGSSLWTPVVHPVDRWGQQFTAANAPFPVELTLRGEGALTQTGAQFTATPGRVSISVATALPVRGLSSFEVVGPSAVTSVEGALVLRKAASKGSVIEELEEGGSSLLWHPEGENRVDIHMGEVQTSAGRLCAPVPAAWFEAVSATPSQCEVAVSGEPYGGDVSVAKVVSAGECRLEVTMPQTTQRWSARFSTTR